MKGTIDLFQKGHAAHEDQGNFLVVAGEETGAGGHQEHGNADTQQQGQKPASP